MSLFQVGDLRAATLNTLEHTRNSTPETAKPPHSLGWCVGLRGDVVHPRSGKLGRKPGKKRGVTCLCFVSALHYVASLFYLKVYVGDFPGDPEIKTLPANQGVPVPSLIGGSKIPHSWWPNRQQKHCCNKFNKDLREKGAHIKRNLQIIISQKKHICECSEPTSVSSS